MRLNRTLRGWFARGLAVMGITVVTLAVAGCDRCRNGCREYSAPVYSNGPAYGGGYYPARYARRDYGDRRAYRNNWNNGRYRDCD